MDEFNEMVVIVEIALFLDGYYKAWEWVVARVEDAKGAIPLIDACMRIGQDHQWRPAGLMSSRLRGNITFQSMWSEPTKRRERSSAFY